MPEAGRWDGRNPAKDAIRDEVWGRLEAARVASGRTPMATSVHALRVAPDDVVVMEPQGTLFDLIATIPFLSCQRDPMTAGSVT
ncbi:MAG: hypothetical protein V4753_08445 [Pseudomonadota bacterium]